MSEKTFKVARLYFKHSGDGFFYTPWRYEPGSQSGDSVAVGKLDMNMSVPSSYDAKFGALSKITNRDWRWGLTPYDIQEHDWATKEEKKWDPRSAYTLNEYKQRIKSGEIKDALIGANNLGYPIGIDVFDVPESAVLYGDDQQIVFDNKKVGWKPSQFKNKK